MINKYDLDLPLLEEMANEAEIRDPRVLNTLEYLSANWNPTMAKSLFDYLISVQDGNYFLEDIFLPPSDQEILEGELVLGIVMGRD